MHRRVPAKGLSPMEKKVPRNEKYSHVRGTLDTGMTVDKVKFVTAREYSKRRDEIFFRLNKNQLYELFNEYEASEYENITESGHSSGGLKIVTHTTNEEPVNEKPYLILDVRDTESFNNYHILQARSFPYALLRRDQLHPEIYKFRNKQDTLIIVCCDDEKISKDAAKTLVDRGSDNVYLLTGGINEFGPDFPAFIEGIPPSPRASTKLRASSRNLDRIPENEDSRHQLTPNKLLRHNATACPPAASSRANLSSGRLTHRDDRSESGVSTRSNMSVAESVISRASARKGKF